MKTLYEKIKEKHGKPKQILFNTEMVRAILDGQKTQTRRPIQAPGNEYCYEKLLCDWGLSRNPKIIDGELHWQLQTKVDASKIFVVNLIYQPGDILYVRETFSIDKNGEYVYRTNYGTTEDDSFTPSMFKWKPSIHMPKEAARIFLKITDVRVERLQEIQYTNNAEKEGFYGNDTVDSQYYFCLAWDSIYKEKGYGWDDNPFVWVIEFEVLQNDCRYNI